MYLVLLILHFLGLVLGVGTSFAMLRLGFATKDDEPVERTKFMLRASVLSKNGSLGLLLLILSGVAMLILRGPLDMLRAYGAPLHAKLTLVVIMMGVLGYLQVVLKKARVAGGGPMMAKLPKLSAAMLLLGVATIVCAVLAFK